MINLDELSADERERLMAGRSDWRDADWQDHCGNLDCVHGCDGDIPDGRPNLLRVEERHARLRLRVAAGLEQANETSGELARLELALRMAKELDCSAGRAFKAIATLETAGLITITG
jgi:hypothetical protein